MDAKLHIANAISGVGVDDECNDKDNDGTAYGEENDV